MTTISLQASKSAVPFILQLDLHMDAPVITMPRFSDSNDNVKVDLGAVRMSNAVAWHAGSSPTDPQAWHPRSSTAAWRGHEICSMAALPRQSLLAANV